MSDPTTPTTDDMTVLDTEIRTSFIIQRELPGVPGQWQPWSGRSTRAEAEVVCNSYSAAFPNENYRVRRAFEIITRVVEN